MLAGEVVEGGVDELLGFAETEVYVAVDVVYATRKASY